MPGADHLAAGMGLNPDVDYLPPGLSGYYKEPFSYSVTFLNVQNVLSQGQTQIQNDSYFVVTQHMCDIWDHATGNTTNIAPNVAPATVRLFNSSSGKTLMDNPIPLGALFGTGSQPFILFQRAYVYRPGGQIQVELTPRFTAAQDVRFTFFGFKVYTKVPDDLSAMT